MFDEMLKSLLKPVTEKQDKAEARLANLENLLVQVIHLMSKWMKPVPGLVNHRQVREEENMLVYEFDLPSAEKQLDIVTKRLRLKTKADDGTEAQLGPFDVPYEALVSAEIGFEQDLDVEASYTYVDDAGLESLASVLSFRTADTTPPPAPGAFGVRQLREEFPEVDPPVDPPVE